MKNEERASISIMKIICLSIILILISGISVMAINDNLKSVNILLQNGYELQVFTNKSTVADILSENNVMLEENQKTVPALETEIQAGQTIKITSIDEKEVEIAEVSEEGVNTTIDELLEGYAPITEKVIVEQIEIPFETITKDVAEGATDTTNKVLQQGKNGLKEVTYKVKYQNDTEIERTVLSEVVITEPVNQIVQVSKKVVTSRGSSATRTGYGTWTYSASDFDLLCAITAQECSSSYTGALAVITTACNRAEAKGSDPLTQYKAPGQFCYSIDTHWVKRLNGNYSSVVTQAVTDALNGVRNHNYFSFRAGGTHSGELIGGNVYF